MRKGWVRDDVWGAMSWGLGVKELRRAPRFKRETPGRARGYREDQERGAKHEEGSGDSRVESTREG